MGAVSQFWGLRTFCLWSSELEIICSAVGQNPWNIPSPPVEPCCGFHDAIRRTLNQPGEGSPPVSKACRSINTIISFPVICATLFPIKMKSGAAYDLLDQQVKNREFSGDQEYVESWDDLRRVGTPSQQEW